jgi:hypothetical protein
MSHSKKMQTTTYVKGIKTIFEVDITTTQNRECDSIVEDKIGWGVVDEDNKTRVDACEKQNRWLTGIEGVKTTRIQVAFNVNEKMNDLYAHYNQLIFSNMSLPRLIVKKLKTILDAEVLVKRSEVDDLSLDAQAFIFSKKNQEIF